MHIQVSLMVDIDASADLSTIETQVQAAGHQAMREAFAQTVRQWERAHRRCPFCGSDQVRQEGTVSRQLQALFGVVRLARQRLRCQRCFRRFCPANPLLWPLAQARVTPALAQAACIAGASWPYQQAAMVLHRLCGARISAEEIRVLTNREGRQRAQAQEQEAAQEPCPSPGAQAAQTLSPGHRTIIGLDGGWIPNREKRGGMEGKVGVVARDAVVLREPSEPSGEMTFVQLERYLQHHRHPSVRRRRWQTRRYVATFASSAVVGRLAAKAVEQVGDPRCEEVVVADGARWIKTETQRHFPHATKILDWPHLARTMAKAVRAVGQDREASQQWVEDHIHQVDGWLWKGEIEPAAQVLQKWQDERKGHPKMKALTAAITYLHTQRDWIGRYEQWKRQDYPIGSGIIERAIALVINRRMKRQGMSWLRRNATSVVALRVALLNEEGELPAPTHRIS